MRLSVDTAGLPPPAHAQRRAVLLPRPARTARGSLHAPALDHARGAVRAAAGAAAAGADHRLRPVRDDDVRPAARERRSTSSATAGSRRPRSSLTRRTVCADLPVEAQPAAAHGGLSPARPAFRFADLRRLRRGHARVHLRAAVRAPDAGKTLPRARTQPPAADRQRFLQLAGAPVSAHGQAQASRPIRATSARCSPTITRCRTDGWSRSCSRSACARASTAAPRHSSPSCTRAGRKRQRPAAPSNGRQRAAALPAAGARDAGERDLHQLRARGPARRAAAQGRAATPPA